MPAMAMHSEEVNVLVYRYLEESGFRHASFAFHHESRLEETGLLERKIPPGALIRILHKGMLYMSMEAHVKEDGTEMACDAPFSLLEPHECHISNEQKDAMDTDIPTVEEEEEEADVADNAEHDTRDTEREKRTNNTRGTKSKPSRDRRGRADTQSKTSDAMVVDTPVNISDSGHEIDREGVTILDGHMDSVYVGAWNTRRPDIYASGSKDGTARIWKLPSQPGEQPVSNILNHPSWPADDKNEVTALCWNPAGTLLASGTTDGQIRIWTIEGAMRFVLSQHTGPVLALKWNPSGSMIVSGSADSTITLWETARGEEVRTYRVHTDSVMDLDWRSDTMFASSSVDQTICIWDANTPDMISQLKGHKDGINCIQWDPSGELLASGADDATVKIWSTHSTDAVSTLNASAAIYTIQWCPMPGSNVDQHQTRRMLATVSHDSSICLWDVDAGTQLHVLKFHTDNVYSIGFNHQGTRLASGSADCNLAVWDVQSGALVCYYRGDSNIFEVGWNADDSKLAVCFANNQVAVIDNDKLT